MILKLQIISLISSFLYGIFFYIISKLNYKFLYNNKLSLIIDILFIIDNVLLYFIILKYINNGIFHIYFLLTLILGYLLSNYIDKRIHK